MYFSKATCLRVWWPQNTLYDHKDSKTLSAKTGLELLFYYLFQYFQKTNKISHALFSFTQRKGNLRESMKYLYNQTYFHITGSKAGNTIFI